MTDHPIEHQIARLEAELKLKKLELKLIAAKGPNGTKPAPAKLKLQVRQARQAFREQYRPQVNVNPDALGMGAGVADVRAGS
jgi:hypothetical protein